MPQGHPHRVAVLVCVHLQPSGHRPAGTGQPGGGCEAVGAHCAVPAWSRARPRAQPGAEAGGSCSRSGVRDTRPGHEQGQCGQQQRCSAAYPAGVGDRCRRHAAGCQYKCRRERGPLAAARGALPAGAAHALMHCGGPCLMLPGVGRGAWCCQRRGASSVTARCDNLMHRPSHKVARIQQSCYKGPGTIHPSTTYDPPRICCDKAARSCELVSNWRQPQPSDDASIVGACTSCASPSPPHSVPVRPRRWSGGGGGRRRSCCACAAASCAAPAATPWWTLLR